MVCGALAHRPADQRKNRSTVQKLPADVNVPEAGDQYKDTGTGSMI